MAVEGFPLAPRASPRPPDLRPVSNVYRLDLACQPSGTAVGTGAVAPGATVALTGATQGGTMLLSAGGQARARVAAQPFGNTHGVVGAWARGALGVALVAGGVVGLAFWVRNRARP